MNTKSEYAQQLALIDDLNAQPFIVGDKNFIHLNDSQEAYIVTKGNAYIFTWLLKDNQATSERQFVCTINTGELMLGSADYADKDKQLDYGFYVLLDYNTELSIIKTNTLFGHKDTKTTAQMINTFVDKISFVITAYNDINPQASKIDPTTTYIDCQKDNWLMTEDKSVLWLKSKQSAAYLRLMDASKINFEENELIPVTVSLHIHIDEGHIFDVLTTEMLLEQNLLTEQLYKLNHYLKQASYQYLTNNIEQQKRNFIQLKSAQQGYLSSAFTRLYSAYKGNVDITPLGVVVDDKISINMLINEVCRATNVSPILSAYPLLEQLDAGKKEDLEHALSIQNFNTRDIILEKDWYQQNHWLILTTLVDSKQTVLLKHHKKNYYYYNPKTNTWHKVDKKVAENISTNAMMIYRPLPETPIKDGIALFKHGLFFSKQDLRQIIWTAILIALVTLVTPVAMGHLLAQAIPNYDIGQIYGFLLALLTSSIGILVFQLSNSIALLRLESKFALDIHASIWMRLLKLPPSFFSQYSVGDLSNRANLVSDIRSVWSVAMTSAIVSMVSMVATFFLLFYYSWHLALISLLLFSVIVSLIVFFIRSIMPVLTDSYEYRGKLDGLVFQLLSGIHKLRIAAKENTLLSLWSNIYANLTVANRKFMLSSAIMQSITQMLPLLSSIIIFSFIYYGLFQSGYNKDFDLGDFVAFNTAFGQLIGSTILIGSMLISVVSTIPMFRRILPILQQEVESNNSQNRVTNFRGNIEFSHVSFRYRKDMDLILNNLSFNIREGEYVAIVGKSGSGKSTIAKLLMGFETQESGTISVDGSDIRELNTASLRSHIGIVLQDNGIIPGSISENISSGNALMTQDDIWDILEKVGLKDEVKKMPMNIHTFISEGGVGLSGGQLQRLIIARALANSPDLLLFDEATSAMDNISQAIIKETLGQMHITRIVIAHRLSTIEDVDKIYVIDNGKIIECGDYKTLMSLKGFFCELVKRQQ